MELSEIKRRIEAYQDSLTQIRGLFDLENKETNIQEYEEMMTEPNFGTIKIKHKILLIKITL